MEVPWAFAHKQLIGAGHAGERKLHDYRRRRARTGSGLRRFQTSWFLPTPATTSKSATLSTTRTLGYIPSASILCSSLLRFAGQT